MKRYSIMLRPYGVGAESERVLCQVDESPEGVAQVIRARHRYESVRVVENIDQGELGNSIVGSVELHAPGRTRARDVRHRDFVETPSRQ
jgi:hypothetical protein